MEFSKEYFWDEVRDGFYVSGIMKRSLAAQMEVLGEIDKVCKRHNIRWFADCGTLLGAVRHGGVIPWDDDVDIVMRRRDYIEFLKVAQNELPEGYLVRNMYTEPDYYECNTRVVNRKVFSFDEEFLRKYHQFPFVSGIDIFVLDNVFEDDVKEKWRIDMALATDSLMDDYISGELSEDKAIKKLGKIQKICNYQGEPRKNLLNEMYIFQDYLYQNCTDDNAGEIAIMSYWVKARHHKFKRADYDYSVNLAFETGKIPVPIGYEDVLYNLYGDYMKVSKVGGLHDYPLFKAQEDLLNKKLGHKLCGCDLKSLKEPAERSYTRDDLKGLIKEGFDKLDKINTILIKSGDDLNSDSIMEFLGQAQNSAIELGNAIEQLQGEGLNCVGKLELYCEEIYKIYEGTKRKDDTLLEKIVEDVRLSVEEEIINRKEILIIKRAIHTDKSLKRAIAYANSIEGDKNITVLEVEDYDKDALGQSDLVPWKVRKCLNEMDFPEVKFTSEYDIAMRHPDVIIIMDGYDNCNYVSCTKEEYWSDNLRINTDRLVYIPDIQTDDIQKGEEKSLQAMEYYVTVPGIANADEIILWSEEIRKSYIDKLVEVTGENKRTYWEDKIKADFTLWEDEEKDSKSQKTIAFFVSVSGIYTYKEKAIEKLKEILAIFKENAKALDFVWIRDENMEVLKDICGELYQEYEKIYNDYIFFKEETKKETKGDSKTKPDYDGYYGSPSPLVRECVRKNKPVMIMSFDV